MSHSSCINIFFFAENCESKDQVLIGPLEWCKSLITEYIDSQMFAMETAAYMSEFDIS